MAFSTELFLNVFLVLHTKVWEMHLHVAVHCVRVHVCAVCPESHLFDFPFVVVVLRCRGLVFGKVNIGNVPLVQRSTGRYPPHRCSCDELFNLL